MTGDIEAAGDALTGGLIARAVEPKHGEGGAGHAALCLNCATALTGPYCHNCGQAAHVHRSLAAIWHDIAHGVLHFEGKIWRTLPLLAIRPGELTRRYIHGERARFVSPMALFLFSVFLMFAAVTIAGAGSPTIEGRTSEEAAAGIAGERSEIRAEIARLDRERAEAQAAGRSSSEAAGERAALEGIDRILGGGPTVLTSGETNVFGPGARTGWDRLDKGIAKAEANPSLLLYKVQNNAYKFSWALIPISVPFLWLIFAWRRQYHAYDHAVFVTYSLSFMTLFGLALALLDAAGLSGGAIFLLAVVVPPLHIYRQLRGAYLLGRANAILRTAALLFFATLAIVAFGLLLLGLGLLG